MTQGQYAPVNGLELYYEVRGSGKPLILLHGGFGTIDMFGSVLPMLAETRQVIAVELQAHGHTADIKRPLSFEHMADDIAGLIRQLGLAQVDLIGYSLGGGVALQTAIRHPKVVDKMVLVSTPYESGGWYPEVRAGMGSMKDAEAAKAMVGSPMHQGYLAVAPRPEDWATFVAKMGQLLSQDYDWSPAVSQLKAPTMIVVGDADSVRASHAVAFFELLGGGQRDAGWDGSGMSKARLAILPGMTHYTIFSSPRLATTATSFLNEMMATAK